MSADAAVIVEESSTTPAPNGGTSRPAGMTKGADGNIWFVEQFGNRVGSVDASTRLVVVEKTIPTASSAPVGIAAGPDGNLWFTESATNKIGVYVPTTDQFREYGVPTAASGPHAIAVGSDNNLWFTERDSSKIGRVTVGGMFDEFALAPRRQPDVIVAGPDGNLWFTEQAGASIARITPSGVITEFPLKAGSCPHGISGGPDGRIWFTESPGRCDSKPNNDIGDKIGRLDINGSNPTEFLLPPGIDPHNIITGPDNNMAFTEKGADAVRRITTAGVFVDENKALTLPSLPGNLTSDGLGHIWFGGLTSGKLVRLTLA